MNKQLHTRDTGWRFSEATVDGDITGTGMTRGMLIGGGSAPAKSILTSVVGADDELSYDTENNINIQAALNLYNITAIFTINKSKKAKVKHSHQLQLYSTL